MGANPALLTQALAPTVSSAAISSSATGVASLVLTFSQSCSIGAGGSGGMTITPSGGGATLGTPTGFPGVTGTYGVTDRYILGSESVTRTYVNPVNGIEATISGLELSGFTTAAVTNNSTVIAYDLFNRANSGTLGANWTDIAAGFGVVSNQASATSSGVVVTSYSATTPTSNCRFGLTLRTTPSANILLILLLRYDDGSGNGYSIEVNGSALTINREDGGVKTQLATNSTAFASGDIISVEMVGSNIVVYKNGTSALTASSGTYTTTQPVKIVFIPTGTQTFAFDNFFEQNL